MLDILVEDICIKIRKSIKNLNCGGTVRGRCKCARGISIHMLALVYRIFNTTVSLNIRLCSKDAAYYLAMYEGEQKLFPVFESETVSGPYRIAGFSGSERASGEDEYYIRPCFKNGKGLYYFNKMAIAAMWIKAKKEESSLS